MEKNDWMVEQRNCSKSNFHVFNNLMGSHTVIVGNLIQRNNLKLLRV